MSKSYFKQDFAASLVVFLVALPLCLGIAIASGLPPAAGLISGMIGGIVVGSLAGCPLQVSGPAAGLVVIVWEIVHRAGVEGLAAAVILAGLLQMMAAYAKIGRWFQAVSPAVVHGMLTSIGILIVLGQIHVIFDVKPQGSGLDNLSSVVRLAITGRTSDGSQANLLAGFYGIAALLILTFWSKTAPGYLRMIPAPLFAVTGLTLLASLFQSHTLKVNVPSSLLASLNFGGLPTLLSKASYDMLTAGFTIAIVASAETLLSSGAVKRLKPKSVVDYDQELFAQGVGNLSAGLLGGLPMTGVIVRSTANISAGGQTRFAAIFHGFWILVFVVLVPDLLNQIPVTVLGGTLAYFGIKLINIKVLKDFAQQSRAELFIFIVTVIAIISSDLLIGVTLGVALSLIRLTLGVSQLDAELSMKDEFCELRLSGVASFLSLPKIIAHIEHIPEEKRVRVDTRRLLLIDHACLEYFLQWQQHCEDIGQELEFHGPALSARLISLRRSPEENWPLMAEVAMRS